MKYIIHTLKESQTVIRAEQKMTQGDVINVTESLNSQGVRQMKEAVNKCTSEPTKAF